MAAPKLITRQTLANAAASRWEETISSVGNFYYPDGVSCRARSDTLIALRELGSTPNPDDVDTAIGNKSWTEVPRCDGCARHRPVVVQVGEEIDYDSATAYLCVACLRAAIALTEAA